MFKRVLDLPALLKKKSLFLLGPRATGKSSLIKAEFEKSTLIINLLQNELFLQLSQRPEDLEGMINAHKNQKIIVIDEIQRVPALLNEIHRLIEDRGIKFLMTGSSARNLRKKGVNLLAGRAWEANLFPLVSHEIPKFDLGRYLRYGGLPAIYLSGDPEEDLHAYVNTYLQQEIQAEAVVRKVPSFARFLKSAAFMSGRMLNFAELSNDAAIPASTIREYYYILEDTLLGFFLPAWTKTQKRKAISTAKFYFFDLGVKNTLAGIKVIEPKSDLFGQAFEHFIALELRAYLSYSRTKSTLSYWQSKHGHEVDFIVGDDIAIEIKSTDKVQEKHLKNISVLAEEKICKKYFLVSFDKIARVENTINVLHWQDFLTRLWGGEII